MLISTFWDNLEAYLFEGWPLALGQELLGEFQLRGTDDSEHVLVVNIGGQTAQSLKVHRVGVVIQIVTVQTCAIYR